MYMCVERGVVERRGLMLGVHETCLNLRDVHE
jgi:hypothetical protein